MPPKRSASSELGDGDFAIDHNSLTGRPIRKRRKTQDASPFVDSAIAVSDPEDYDSDVSGDGEVVVMRRPRKPKPRRPRSPSPPLSDDYDHMDEASLDDFDAGSDLATPTIHAGSGGQLVIKNLVINVPPSHRGPITLQLPNPNNPATSDSNPCSIRRTRSRPASKRDRSPILSHSKTARHAGFLDLPAELRNEVYQQVLVADKELAFDVPYNFSRGAALLRTCRQVHDEGRGVLYGQNSFTFVRRSARCGSYWATEWDDVGYKAVRRFLKQIGPSNTALLRHLALVLTDATPSLSPGLSTIDRRRFVNDDILLSILRHLADHARLHTLSLHFHGRRRVERADNRFLGYLLEIEADDVSFTRGRNMVGVFSGMLSKQDPWVERNCLEVMTRRDKLYDDR